MKITHIHQKMIQNRNKKKGGKRFDNLEKKRKKSKKELIKLGNYSLYKIPFQENKFELIKKIHEENNHRN